MTPNFIGWIGFAIMAFGLIGIGMLIENIRSEAMKRPRKINPRPVPQEPEEWRISSAAAFEEACRRVVQESPEKFR